MKNFNKEAVLSVNPQVIIDVGEKKATIVEDMDQIQASLGIPVIFIEARLDNTDEAYRTLGKILGREEEVAGEPLIFESLPARGVPRSIAEASARELDRRGEVPMRASSLPGLGPRRPRPGPARRDVKIWSCSPDFRRVS